MNFEKSFSVQRYEKRGDFRTFFPCEFRKMFKNTYFIDHLRAAASNLLLLQDSLIIIMNRDMSLSETHVFRHNHHHLDFANHV